MKRIIGVTALTIILTLAGQKAVAQAPKFAHINSEELIQLMPEFDTASKQIEKFRQDLVNTLELMQVELNNKSDAYNKDAKNLTDMVKQVKEQELMDINNRIQQFQNSAQQQLQEKQVELFQPIYQKVDKAIKDVGKENGFTYVFDVAKGALLYFDETKSTNLLALTKAKLGLK
jgi:outer membrane protein